MLSKAKTVFNWSLACFGTFGGVPEPSDPVLGLLKYFLPNLARKDTFCSFNWIWPVFRDMRASSRRFGIISHGANGRNREETMICRDTEEGKSRIGVMSRCAKGGNCEIFKMFHGVQ